MKVAKLIENNCNTEQFDAIYFMMMSTSEVFFIWKKTSINLKEIDKKHRRIYVTWKDTQYHSHYINFEDIDTILQCVLTAYGEYSNSYREWRTIYKKI